MKWWFWNRLLIGLVFGMFVSHIVEKSIMVEHYKAHNYIWCTVTSLSAVTFAIVFFFTKKFAKLMTGCLAFAMMGKCIAALINSFMTEKLPGWASLLIVAVFAILGVILAAKHTDFIVILGTAWIGTYCLCAGLGMLFSHYPDPTYGTPFWIFWLYFLTQALSFNLCVTYQCSERNEPRSSKQSRNTTVEVQVTVESKELSQQHTEELSIE